MQPATDKDWANREDPMWVCGNCGEEFSHSLWIASSPPWIHDDVPLICPGCKFHHFDGREGNATYWEWPEGQPLEMVFLYRRDQSA